tara:strand:+ start:1113 stop:1562 length:450 start_codon:yes stop_codon:yes gene_type:complete
MVAFFTNIFEFHYKINQSLINQMIENTDKVSKKANLLMCHSINAHQIWNSRITNEKSLGVFDIYPLNKCINLNKSNLDTTCLILQNEDFQKTILYQNSKGVAYKNTIQEILFHISNHYSHHRGQLISELKQNDIEPIISDYIFHKRNEL